MRLLAVILAFLFACSVQLPPPIGMVETAAVHVVGARDFARYGGGLCPKPLENDATWEPPPGVRCVAWAWAYTLEKRVIIYEEVPPESMPKVLHHEGCHVKVPNRFCHHSKALHCAEARAAFDRCINE